MITFQQLKDFINSQPDDRPVDMCQNMNSEECGCVMIHYGRDVLGIPNDYVSAGFSTIFDKSGESETEFDIEGDIRQLIPNTNYAWYAGIQTYKNLKDIVNEE